MKRIFKVILFVIIGLLLLSCTAAAVQESNIDEYAKEFDVAQIYDYIDAGTLALLEEFGVSEINMESLFSIEPTKIFNALFNIVNIAVRKPLQFLACAAGVVLLTSAAKALLDNDELVEIIGSSALALCSAACVVELVSTALTVLESLLYFTTGFAGVFSAVVASAGSISAGASYGALTIFANTALSGVLVNLAHPIVNALCAVGFMSCFDVYSYTHRVSSIVKKAYVFVLSLAGTIFSGLVTLKGVVDNSVDSLSSRGVRFVIGQSLPIVGGAVSETYSTIITSLNLIKNAVGVFGIITVVVIVLPVFLELCCWILVFELSLNIAEITEINKTSGLLNILKDALTLLVSTIVILTAVFIVCIGVCISAKGSAA